jgi:hypothetical protein
MLTAKGIVQGAVAVIAKDSDSKASMESRHLAGCIYLSGPMLGA